jgi:hypothetical protein
MVNANRVKTKLPSLQADGSTAKRKGRNEFFRYRYQLQQLKKRNPQRFNTLTNTLLAVLNDIKTELRKEMS